MRLDCTIRTKVCATTKDHTFASHSLRGFPCQPNPARGSLGTAGLIVLALAFASQLALAVPLFDPFADATASGGTSYAVGSTVTNQFNPALFNAWYQRGVGFGSVTPLIASGSLSYPGLPASTGNSASFAPASSSSACLELNEPAGGQPAMVFCSYLLQITDITAVPTTAANNPFAAYGDDPSRIPNQIGRLGTRVLTKKVGSGYVLGTSMTQLTADFIYEPDANAHNVGDTLFIVQGYQQTVGVETNVQLWINPSASSFGASTPPPATLTAPVSGGALNGKLNANGARLWVLLCQFTTAPSGVIDDVRIATDWAAVTGGPGIYMQPTNQTADAGTSVTFTVRAFGGTPLSYQWQKDGVNLSNGGNISGATSSALSISSVLQGDSGSYSAIVTNSYSAATSASATLTVNDPFITTQPTNRTVAYGATVALSVVAVGTPTLTYQWYKDSSPLSDGGHVSGSLTATLTITGFSASDIGVYNVIVANGLGSSVTSSNAQLQATDPSISTQPVSVTNIYATTATFQVTASGTAPFSYQWHRAGFGDLSDGGNILGSQTSALAISGVSFLDAGTYSVTVNNALGSADSAPAVLTVRDPAITTQPVSVTTNAGAAATFDVGAIGTASLGYQWRTNGSDIFDNATYSGTGSDRLTVSSVSAAEALSYSVVVSGGSGLTETSAVATLTVISPVAITAQPNSRAVVAGSPAVLAVGATGTALQYRWQLEGSDVPGATSFAYTIANVQAPVTGNYRVIVSNTLNAETSSVAVVSIVSPLHLYASNVVALRIGNGAQTLATKGNSVALDQFTPGGSYLSTVVIPDSGPTALLAIGPTLTTSPSSVTGNSLSRSANGRFLSFGAYNTNLNSGAELQSVSATTVPRGIGLVDDRGQYTLAISSTNSSSGNFFRGAVADGTNNYWGCSRTSSSYYFGFDAPGVQIQSDWINMRNMACFNGEIYGTSAVQDKTGVMKLAGLPTTPEAVQFIINTGRQTTEDCEVSPNGNLIYVADDWVAAGGGGGGIRRYDFDGTSWTFAYALNDQLPNGARYVTADFSGANPVVYAVSNEQLDATNPDPNKADNNTIVRIEDTGPGSLGTVIAHSGINQNFRGIRMGPLATTNTTRPTLSETPGAGTVILNWNGSFFLQSATNVTGPYSDIINGTRPYTNSTTSPSQKFFRLRQ
jgi:hypothetical protein